MLTFRSLATAATAGLTALTVALPAVQASEGVPAAPLADGTYLYGETTEPEAIGATYMTFEVREGRLIGAFYQPQSSFDCFAGTFQGNRLALTITDSYAQTSYAYEVAIAASSSEVASQKALPGELMLDGLRPLAAASESDREIVATCRTALAE